MSLTIISNLVNEGKNEEALSSLNELPNENKNFEFYKLRGHVFSQMGLIQEYMNNLIQTADNFPENENAVMELCELLFDTGKKFKARPFLKAFLEKSPECEWAQDMLNQLPENYKLPSDYSEEFLEHFLSLFTGREEVYAKQTENINGKPGYYPVYNPFRQEELISHLKGKITAGLYLVRRDNSVAFIVIDIDIRKKFLPDFENLEEKKELEKKLKEEVYKITKFCEEKGLPYLLEYSGYKGFHLWFLFENPVEASQAREFGKKILLFSDPPDIKLHRELFPKQDSVPDDGLGNLVKLPLGIHKKTGNQCLLIDSDTFEFYPDQISALYDVKTIKKNIIDSIIKLEPEVQRDNLFTGEPQGKHQDLAGKCNVLKFLIQKARSEYHLSRREKMVLSYILGYMEEDGRAYFHWLLSHCKDYSYEEAQEFLDGLKPKPMGCSRIRYWLPHIVSKVECNCKFKLSKGSYPTPLLHSGHIPRLPEKKNIEGLLKTYVKTLSELEEKKKTLIKIEQHINRTLDEQETESIDTGIGNLVRIKENGSFKFSIILKSFYENKA